MRVRPQAHFVYRGGARCRTCRTLRQRCRSLGEGDGGGGPAAEHPPPPGVPGGRMSSPVIQTAPLEVGRSSSQSALSERPGRWNGRVERGAESARKRDCSHGDCPPTLVGLRGGRLSPQDLSYEPSSPRDARPVHLGPSPSVHRPTRLTRPLAGAGSQASPPGRRASSEKGAGARDILSKPACRCMHGRSETLQPLEWLRSRPSRQVDKRGGGQ